MYEYIIDEAKTKVWCNPYQDNQTVIEPEKITTGAGAMNNVQIFGRFLELPQQSKRFQVYQIGQYPPYLLGLLENWPTWAAEKWFSFEEAMNQLPLYANIYNNKGANIPRSQAYFMMTREKCLVVAVLTDPRIKINYSKEPIYVRLYTSAYLKSSIRTGTSVTPITVRTFQVDRMSDISGIRGYFASQQALVGHAEAFMNGQLIEVIDGKTVELGSVVEIIQEASVKRMVNWKISALRPFTSTMDKKSKYILHYPKATEVPEIDFFDDIDVYVSYTTEKHGERGYYYHKNLPSAMRMLTHRDYSLAADYVTYVLDSLFADLGIQGGDYMEAEITLKIRRNDYTRGLIWDPNKIFEMYRLSDTRIMMAMSGVDSLAPPWWAANLEESTYSLFMGELYKGLTIENAEAALGYNYISKVLGDSPIKVNTENATPLVPLPYGLAAKNSTAYELNAQGQLTGVYLHDTRDNDYNLRDPNTKMVEMVMGIGTNRPDVVYGTTDLILTPDCDYRVYQCWMDFSQNPPVPNNQWKDITGDESLIKVIDGKVKWVSGDTGQYLMLKTDSSFLAYSFQSRLYHGNMLFQITELSTIEGETIERACTMPGRDLQIWLNGNNLVQGVDYVVNFPWVCVNNYRFFRQPTASSVQNLHVRMTGFCEPDMQLGVPEVRGFVINGAISDNAKYNIYPDKVLHISIGGSIKSPEDVLFYENNPVVAPMSPWNGYPYQIRRVVVPLRDFTKSGTYPLLKIADETDKIIEGYMDLYFPKPSDPPYSQAQARWVLVSPFFSNLIEMCLTEEITIEPWVVLSDEDVLEMCKPYTPLLKFDPIDDLNRVEDAYVNIIPHRHAGTVQVDRPQYRFLKAAFRLFGNDLVGLNNFVTFTV